MRWTSRLTSWMSPAPSSLGWSMRRRSWSAPTTASDTGRTPAPVLPSGPSLARRSSPLAAILLSMTCHSPRGCPPLSTLRPLPVPRPLRFRITLLLLGCRTMLEGQTQRCRLAPTPARWGTCPPAFQTTVLWAQWSHAPSLLNGRLPATSLSRKLPTLPV